MSGASTLAGTRIPFRYSLIMMLRGVMLWVLARLSVKALYMFIADIAGGDSEMAAALANGRPIILAAWTIVLSAALLRLDVYRRHEVALMNNLGVVTSQVVLLGTLPAVVMETALVVVR